MHGGAIAAGQGGGHQGHHLIARIGSARHPSSGAGQPVGAGRDAGLGWLAGSAIGCSWSGTVLYFGNHYPGNTGALSYPFSTPRHSSFRWIGGNRGELREQRCHCPCHPHLGLPCNAACRPRLVDRDSAHTQSKVGLFFCNWWLGCFRFELYPRCKPTVPKNRLHYFPAFVELLLQLQT